MVRKHCRSKLIRGGRLSGLVPAGKKNEDAKTRRSLMSAGKRTNTPTTRRQGETRLR
jgi:hypothetical protein